MPDNFEKNLDALLADVRKTLISKRGDYGTRNLLIFGERGIIVRMGDKMFRLDNLLDKEAPENEPLEDSYRDIAGYAFLGWLIRQGKLND